MSVFKINHRWIYGLRKGLLFAAILLLLTLIGGNPLPAEAATVTVCDSGCDYSSIQSAVTAATTGDTISIAAGTYYENVTITKAVTLQGASPSTTIIDGGGSGSTVSVESVPSGVVYFKTLTIRNSGLNTVDEEGGVDEDAGIEIVNSNVNVTNVVITGGYHGISTYNQGTAVTLYVDRTTITNNNGVGLLSSAITAGNILVTLQNDIITYNGVAGVFNWESRTTFSVNDYNNVFGNANNNVNYVNLSGGGNSISINPLYSDSAFHLAPCSSSIDAGEPSSPYTNEPDPNGGQVNMGAYGNTGEATSKSCSADVQLAYDSLVGITLDDDDGGVYDNIVNGTANCGEIIELKVPIENAGTATATGVSATVTTDEPDVILWTNQATQNYPDIAPGGTEENTESFIFMVSAGASGGTIHFNMDITAGNGGPFFNDDFELISVVCPPTVPAPANDPISGAYTVSSLPYSKTQSTTSATVASSAPVDPTLPCIDNTGYNTVWYKYTPTENLTLNIDTIDSAFNTVLGVFTGTPGSLTNVACNNDKAGIVQAEISLDVTGGTTYYVEVAGTGEIEFGSLVIDFSEVVVTHHPDTTGVFRPSNGWIYLKNTNTSGFADQFQIYGIASDIPVSGDWDGDNVDSIGVYRNGVFYLRNDPGACTVNCFADTVIPFGTVGDWPVTGDWDSDGVDEIGVFRNGTFFLVLSDEDASQLLTPFGLGIPGDLPIAGDWDGNGTVTAGVFRPSNGWIYLKNTNTTGFADQFQIYGVPNDLPLAGDWDGDGVDSIGVLRGNWFFLRNDPSACEVNCFADIVFQLGNVGDMPIAGDWDGLP